MMSETENSKLLNKPLLEAVKNGDLDKVEQLLAMEADVNGEGELVNEYGYGLISPLGVAADRGYVDIVRALLQSPNVNINKRDFSYSTPLDRASLNGHLETVEALLAAKKVEINAKDSKYGFTSLHSASTRGHAEVVEALLKYPGILVNAKAQNGNTALHVAASNGNLEVVEILLTVPGILVNEKNYMHDHTPLHLAAAFHHSEVVEALLSHPDTDVNVKDKHLQTPLHTPAYHGDLKTVELLLQGGINANEKADKGYTAAYWAAKQKNTETLELIVNYLKRVEEHGVDVDARKKQVEEIKRRKTEMKISEMQKYASTKENDPNNQLLLAARNNDLEKTIDLLKRSDINVNCMDKKGNTPLHLASEYGCVEVVKSLLAIKEIDINAKNIDKRKLFYPIHLGDNPNRSKLDFGETSLHLAVKNGYLDIVNILVCHPGIDVNAEDKYSTFPLWLAVEKGNKEIVKALLSHPDINVNAKFICSDHFTSLHKAVEIGDLEMVNLLLSHPNIDLNVEDKFFQSTALDLAVKNHNSNVISAIKARMV